MNKNAIVTGDLALLSRLPKDLISEPARMIESLRNYRRPSLMAWLNQRGKSHADTLTLGDLMDLGFDPTRLKEITIDGQECIFERVQARQVPELEKKNIVLERIASEMSGAKVRGAWLKTNPVLLIIRDRGNAYVLRRKIDGIHWEEAIEQLQKNPILRSLGASMDLSRVHLDTVQTANQTVADHLGLEKGTVLNQLTTFLSWDLTNNHPKMIIDFTDTSVESVWMA